MLVFQLEWDYLLLADADMELDGRRAELDQRLKGLAYDIRAGGGALGYYNRRLVNHKAEGWYVGVTHEYLGCSSCGVMDGAEFRRSCGRG